MPSVSAGAAGTTDCRRLGFMGSTGRSEGTLLNDRTIARTAPAISAAGRAERAVAHPGSGQHLHADLAVLARRARYINWAISMCAIAALLVALVVVTLFANAFLRSELALLIALLFVGAIVCLSAALVAFFIEVRLATAALRISSPGP